MVELAPCPFCQSRLTRKCDSNGEYWWSHPDVWCFIQSGFVLLESDSESVERWNTRAASPATVERICRAAYQHFSQDPDGRLWSFEPGATEAYPISGPAWMDLRDAVEAALRGNND